MLGLFWDEENCMHGYLLFAILKNASAFLLTILDTVWMTEDELLRG